MKTLPVFAITLDAQGNDHGDVATKLGPVHCTSDSDFLGLDQAIWAHGEDYFSW